MHPRFEVLTARLTLLGADETLLRSELDSREALAAAAGSHVPPEWPPEHHDQGVIQWVLNGLGALAPDDPWRFYYLVRTDSRTLVGTCGFKGPPDNTGSVEVGYSVLEPYRRRGLASEAVSALMSLAFAHGATEVAAETFPELTASLRVMAKCGMTGIGKGSEAGTVRFSKRR